MTRTSVTDATARRLGGRDRVGTLAAASLGFSVVQYTLMFAALILTAGTLGDRFGSRRMLSAGFTVFMAASLACGLAPGIGVLIAARAVQGGCGAAGSVFPGADQPRVQRSGRARTGGRGLAPGGLLVPPMTSTLMGSVDRSQSGIASGTLNALRQAGSVLGVAVFGSLIAAKGHFGRGFHDALVISIIVIVAGAFLALGIAPAAHRPS